MNPENFATWLQGFAELTPGQTPSTQQWQLIVEKLAEVFDEIKPQSGLTIGGVKIGVGSQKPTGGYAGNQNFGMFADTTVAVANTLNVRAIEALGTGGPGASAVALNSLTSRIASKPPKSSGS